MTPFEASRVLKNEHANIIYDLRYLAKALHITGNPNLADELDAIADRIRPLSKIVDEAIQKDFDAQFAHSQAMAGNLLKLALNGNIRPNDS